MKKMETKTIIDSIAGINKLIKSRKTRLRGMKYWLMNPKKSNYHYSSMISFYQCGIRTMTELAKLIRIKDDLK
jgi:hypothetical protein